MTDQLALDFGGRRLVILSYGLGVDSTAILLRWLSDPSSRDFDLADLIVIVAMTGNEWDVTGRHVEEHILPLLREHGVRFIQVARSQRVVKANGTGAVILDDSTSPDQLFLSGAYRLDDEMLAAGTVPQLGGARKCSMHAKGDVLDHVIGQLTQGAPYRHVIGFEANECTRANKDAGYNTDARTGVYPLIEWGWDRETCEAFILAELGVEWQKSACYFCPFALANKAGRARTLARYAEDPQVGARALFMEYVSLCLNPKQGLLGEVRLIDLVRDAGMVEVLEAFDAMVAAAEHTLYDVRRVYHAATVRDGKKPKINSNRSVRCTDRTFVGTGPLAQIVAKAEARGLDVEVGEDGITRLWAERAEPGTGLTREQFFVVAPAVVDAKEMPRFADWWGRYAPALVA
jgi:hypothetical protein